MTLVGAPMPVSLVCVMHHWTVMAKQISKKMSDTENRKSGGEPGEVQQRPRRDRENMGPGLGARGVSKNQGREGGRGTGRNGKIERGDRVRSARK